MATWWTILTVLQYSVYSKEYRAPGKLECTSYGGWYQSYDSDDSGWEYEQCTYGCTCARKCSINCDEAVKKELGDVDANITTTKQIAADVVTAIKQNSSIAVEEVFEDVCNTLEIISNNTIDHLLAAYEISNGSIEYFRELINDSLWLYHSEKKQECKITLDANACVQFRVVVITMTAIISAALVLHG